MCKFIEFNGFSLEIEEEIEKNKKELMRLKDKNADEKSINDNLVMKIKAGRIISLKESKENLQNDKAKLKSLYFSLDNCLS